ncbi:MAG: ACT domain-containing protein [Planctomycetia bacterium]|nr:ACT domain-containing protein [Planctomycetia bacterium]
MRYGYVFNVISTDRPGIVASVSSAIAKLKGNIESCSQTVLSSYFTLIMIVTLPQKWNLKELEDIILNSEGMNDCQVLAREVSKKDVRPPAKKENTFVVTASGKDREDIVAQFSRYLAGKDINIIDLFGYITTDGNFVMISQVEVDPRLDIQNIQYDLEELGLEFGFTVGLQHNNIFVATNQLRMDS